MVAPLGRMFLLAVVVGLAGAGGAIAVARAFERGPSAVSSAGYDRSSGWPAPRATGLTATVGQPCSNDSPHGSASEGPPDCLVCHRSQPRDGSVELVTPDVYSLCVGCHDGSGAETDVLRGRSTKTGARLDGGGFLFVPDSDGVLRPTTSRHEVAGLPLEGGAISDGFGTAWGSLGPSGNGPGVSGVLTCTSCHDPHGSTNYRLLRDAAGMADRWLTGEPYLGAWQSYQVLAASSDADDCSYASGDRANYTAGMRDYCTTCHTEYLAPVHAAVGYQPSGSYDAGDGEGAVPRFRHAQVFEYEGVLSQPLRLVAPLTLDDLGENGSQDSAQTQRTSVVCTTCHFAHGTAATVTGYAEDAPPTGDSALLYYDGRGVCLACHQLGK
jgi:hypothetical protein